MTTILSKESDCDLELIMAFQDQTPLGDGGFPNAPVVYKDVLSARERLLKEYTQQEISQALIMARKLQQIPLPPQSLDIRP